MRKRTTDRTHWLFLQNIRDPYRCLALTIIAQAYNDAKINGKAKRWLMGNSRMLNLWCEAGEISIDALHKRIREA